MLKKSITLVLIGFSLLAAAPSFAQGLGHTLFMRGMIVDTDATGPVVCIGKADGATVGQVLEVYRVKKHPGSPKSASPSYHRELVGHVTIAQIYDEHFARVSVTDGKAGKYDIVELKK